jgi:integrase
VASILQIGDRWRALIRRKGHKAQCKTFDTKAQALAWARAREGELDEGHATAEPGKLLVREVIRAYRELRDQARPILDTSNEHYMLKALEKGLGEKVAGRLSTDDLIAYAVSRREDGAGPYTINMDVSKLGTVLRYGGAKLKVALPDVVGAARPMLHHLRLIGGGGKRERRPTDDEMQRILHHMLETYGLVYAEAVAFAAITAMRRGEVCAILKTEIDPVSRVIPVWRKHPRKGKVLERVPLLGGMGHCPAAARFRGWPAVSRCAWHAVEVLHVDMPEAFDPGPPPARHAARRHEPAFRGGLRDSACGARDGAQGLAQPEALHEPAAGGHGVAQAACNRTASKCSATSR